MKKFILTLAIAITTISAFAIEKQVNTVVQRSFNAAFVGATDVKWTSSDEYYKASFMFNKQHVTAFYTLTGSLMGVTRNLTSLELPVNLQASFRKDYGGYWITDLFEVSNDEGTAYYMTLENADGKVLLKSGSRGEWSTYKKLTKA